MLRQNRGAKPRAIRPLLRDETTTPALRFAALPEHLTGCRPWPNVSPVMSVEMLEKALGQSRPFAIFLTNGRRIDVAHPEFVWLAPPQKRDLVVSLGRRGGIELVRVNQIVSIRFPDHEAA